MVCIGGTSVMVDIWRSEDNLWGQKRDHCLSFYHAGPGNSTCSPQSGRRGVTSSSCFLTINTPWHTCTDTHTHADTCTKCAFYIFRMLPVRISNHSWLLQQLKQWPSSHRDTALRGPSQLFTFASVSGIAFPPLIQCYAFKNHFHLSVYMPVWGCGGQRTISPCLILELWLHPCVLQATACLWGFSCLCSPSPCRRARVLDHTVWVWTQVLTFA